MTFGDIQGILQATVLNGEEFLGESVDSACGCDFISDVLAYVKDQGVLLTGLVNPQVIRAAYLQDMRCVIFVRGKRPDVSILSLARELEIIVMFTKERMFDACGKLYEAGLGVD